MAKELGGAPLRKRSKLFKCRRRSRTAANR
jgi:hypothetical protein